MYIMKQVKKTHGYKRFRPSSCRMFYSFSFCLRQFQLLALKIAGLKVVLIPVKCPYL